MTGEGIKGMDGEGYWNDDRVQRKGAEYMRAPNAEGEGLKPWKQRITEMPEGERPREKLEQRPAQRSPKSSRRHPAGQRHKNPCLFTVAGRILKAWTMRHAPDVKELQQIEGVGPATAALVAAASSSTTPHPPEVQFPSRPRCSRSSPTWPTASRNTPGISLNVANEVIAGAYGSVGLVDKTHVHPREVYADPNTTALRRECRPQNHPSGTQAEQRRPRDDQNAQGSRRTLGIQLLDHIVFNQKANTAARACRDLIPENFEPSIPRSAT